MKKAIYIICVLWGMLTISAPATANVAGADSLRVSLVTCWPGPEIYELCGHEAIRVKGRDFDYVWNYGSFDFNQPNFIGRFVSGQTDYMVLAYPFELFLPEYVRRGSRVEEQELLLTPGEKNRLLEALKKNAEPQNATYRYNYVRDNCATRITSMLDSTLDRKILFTDAPRFGTYRRAMRHYHAAYPWYQFGIDLVLGSGLDHPVTRRAETFAPVEMHDAYAVARFSGNGGPVVAPPVVLNEGVADATLPPTPWYLTPLAVSILSLMVTSGCWIFYFVRKKLARWWFSVYFGICGIAGCLVAYLVFFSTHEATSPNLLLMWLNPLQLLIAIGVWMRSWRIAVWPVALYDIVALPALMMAWHAQMQSASVPIFLFMASAPLLSILYAIKNAKSSYNKTSYNKKSRKKKK